MSSVRSVHRSRVLISIRGPVAIIYCVGTLDRLIVNDLCDRVRALTFEGVRGIVCSLERVDYIHYQALDQILALHEQMLEVDGRLVLTDASPYLTQILDFGGIPARMAVQAEKRRAVEELLETLPGVREAVAATYGAQPSYH
jgi:anti-anti-sigma factor